MDSRLLVKESKNKTNKRKQCVVLVFGRNYETQVGREREREFEMFSRSLDCFLALPVGYFFEFDTCSDEAMYEFYWLK